MQQAGSRRGLRPGTFWIDGPDTAPTAIWARFPGDRSPDDARVEVGRRDVLFGPIWRRSVRAVRRRRAVGAPSHRGLPAAARREPRADGARCAPAAAAARSRTWRSSGRTAPASTPPAAGTCSGACAPTTTGSSAGWATGRGVTIEDGAAVGNNWKGYDPFWEAGGGKWDRTTGLVIRRHYAAWNDGPGIWLDADNDRNTIEGSLVEHNTMAGLMLELRTTRTLVQHNVARRTRWRGWTGSGLLSQAASRNVILHNTVVENAGIGVWLRLDDSRRAPRRLDDGHRQPHRRQRHRPARGARDRRRGGVAGHARHEPHRRQRLRHRRRPSAGGTARRSSPTRPAAPARRRSSCARTRSATGAARPASTAPRCRCGRAAARAATRAVGSACPRPARRVRRRCSPAPWARRRSACVASAGASETGESAAGNRAREPGRRRHGRPALGAPYRWRR